MNFWKYTLITIVLASLSGCGVPPRARVAIDEMGAELLAVEDRYYELEAKYLRQKEELAACRSGKPYNPKQTFLDRIKGATNSSSSTNDAGAGSTGDELQIEGGLQIDGGEIDGGEQIEGIPGLEFEDEAPNQMPVPQTAQAGRRWSDEEIQMDFGEPTSAPNIEINNVDSAPPRMGTGGPPSGLEIESGNGFQIEMGSEADPQDVSHIHIHPKSTTGRDLNNDQIDDMLSIKVFPRDIDDRKVTKPAKIMVSVLDPAQLGESQRIGIWEFKSEEVARSIDSRDGGIVLDLPWEGVKPVNSDLVVYVRYVDEDRHNLEASMHVGINVPGSIVRVDPPQDSNVRLVGAEQPIQNEPVQRRRVAKQNDGPQSSNYRQPAIQSGTSQPSSVLRNAPQKPLNTRDRWQPRRTRN